MATIRRNWKIWLLVFFCWMVIGLFPSGMHYLREVDDGGECVWWRVLFGSFAVYGLWGLLSPPLIALCRQYPLDSVLWKRNLRVYPPALAAFALVHLTICAFATVISCAADEIRPPLFETFRQFILIYLHLEILAFAVVGGGFHAFRYYRRTKERELAAARAALAAAELESNLKQAQLNALKSQLQPHFLFNALNTISVLMTQNVETANRMLIELSELLRMALRNDANEITLREEMEFLESYLKIEQMRFHDRLKIAFEVEPSALDARVPHLILQPLVENAIKHGVSAREGIGEVAIKITRRRETLELSVRDNGLGFRSTNRKANGAGIGLKNTRRRLEKMYPDRHEIQISETPGTGTLIVIQIPYATVSLN